MDVVKRCEICDELGYCDNGDECLACGGKGYQIVDTVDVTIRDGNPALNVKAYHFTHPNTVQERFGCSREEAEQVLQWAFDLARAEFWEEAQEIAHKYNLGKVYQEGRSGGWLVVSMNDDDGWSEEEADNWQAFEEEIKALKVSQCSDENTLALIEANRWLETGARQYNFFLKNGKAYCFVDLQAALDRAKRAFFEDV